MPTIARTPTLSAARRLSPGLNVAVWCGQVLIALSLFFAGASKLAAAEQAVALFDAVGIGQWFRYVTGVLEVAGSAALVVPRLTLVGAAVLSSVMAGAVLTHLFFIGGSPLVPLMHLVLLLAIGWARLEWPSRRRPSHKVDEEAQ